MTLAHSSMLILGFTRSKANDNKMNEGIMRTAPKIYTGRNPKQTRWIFLTGFLVILSVDSVRSETDSCEDYQLADMYQGRRESTYVSTTDTAPDICDDDLDPNTWMRFGESYQVTTAYCVPVDHCGTSASMWLHGSSPRPSVVGTEVTAKVCMNYGIDGQCCNIIGYATIRLSEDRIDGEFYVYKLPNPQGCYSGYCVDPIPGKCENSLKRGPDGNCIQKATNTDGTITATATTSATTTTSTTTTATTNTTPPKEIDKTHDQGDQEAGITAPTTARPTNADNNNNNNNNNNNKTDGRDDGREQGPAGEDDDDDDLKIYILIVGVILQVIIVICTILVVQLCWSNRRSGANQSTLQTSSNGNNTPVPSVSAGVSAGVATRINVYQQASEQSTNSDECTTYQTLYGYSQGSLCR